MLFIELGLLWPFHRPHLENLSPTIINPGYISSLSYWFTQFHPAEHSQITLQVHHQRTFSTQLYIHPEKNNQNMSQPIIYYCDSLNGFSPTNQSWGWLSSGGGTSYHNKAEIWQISKILDVDLSPVYRTKAAAPFSVRFYTAPAAGTPGSCSSWKSSQQVKSGSDGPCLMGRLRDEHCGWLVWG